MTVKRVDKSQIPDNILGDLESLTIEDKFEYIAIGHSYYILYPTLATKLLDILNGLISVTYEVKRKRYDEYIQNKEKLPEKKRGVILPYESFSVNSLEVLQDKNAREKLINLIDEAIEGVTEEDKSKITIGQIVDIFNKIISVNMKTLPKSFISSLYSNLSSKEEKINTDPL